MPSRQTEPDAPPGISPVQRGDLFGVVLCRHVVISLRPEPLLNRYCHINSRQALWCLGPTDLVKGSRNYLFRYLWRKPIYQALPTVNEALIGTNPAILAMRGCMRSTSGQTGNANNGTRRWPLGKAVKSSRNPVTS